MSDIPAEVRELLACPRCHGPLRDHGTPPTSLHCPVCGLSYPVEGGIPVLLVERATPSDHQ